MKVFVVNTPRNRNVSIERMFTQKDWEITEDIQEANLVQFLGGDDVTPSFYGESRMDSTYCNPLRDKYEKVLFNICKENTTPMAGICRGAQFLNVMNKGKLWQDINNHACSNGHDLIDYETGYTVKASSTHHQEMIPTGDAVLLAVAYEATEKTRMRGGAEVTSFNKNGPDMEVLMYPATSCLCFQPHPEYMGFHELTELYFKHIELLMTA